MIADTHAPMPEPISRPRCRPAVVLAVALILATACSGRNEEKPTTRHEETKSAGAAVAATVGAETGEKREAGDAKAGEGAKESAARVTLGEVAFRTAGILVEAPRSEALSAAGGGLQVPGQVEFDPARVAYVSPRTGGRLERLLAVPGDRVGAGQVVALVQSPAYATAQNDVLQAQRRLVLLRGTADAEGAQALLDAARRRLVLLGASETAIRRLESGGVPEALLRIPAPFAGSIVEASALAGQAVEAGTPLYKIADLSVVNVAADVPERALPAVHVGQGASILAAGAPQAPFVGRVTRVSDVLDPERRTAKALISVANTGRSLKPGMFATVQLRGGGATTVQSLTVPSSAIVTDGPDRYVFVEVGPRTYERRAVELAPGLAGAGPAGGRVAVVSGLGADDRLVVRGAFTLKSELAKASLKDVD
ncbi:MAG: hypothetical protein ABS52_11120 [Gemmatimonadetes bacterium SCN 70-22]|nr:MAG: hypothetical protein ABS52_11120 [Gemmatimonadetes bacterium SCN 70-22]